MPRARAAASTRRKAASCSRRARGRLVGPGQVRVDALELQSGLAATPASSASASSGGTPIRRIPVSTSTWTATGRRARARSPASALQVAGVVEHGGEPPLEGQLAVPVHAPQHQDREPEAGLAQRHSPRRRSSTASCSAARLDQPVRHHRGAVAVGVGLHHGDDHAALGAPPRLGEVRAARHPRSMAASVGRSISRFASGTSTQRGTVSPLPFRPRPSDHIAKVSRKAKGDTVPLEGRQRVAPV